jgi:dihydropteroate synthase
MSLPREITYVRPISFLNGCTAQSMSDNGLAILLAGGPIAFSYVELIFREENGSFDKSIYSIKDLKNKSLNLSDLNLCSVFELLANISQPKQLCLGTKLKKFTAKPIVMGVVNVTPDSFFNSASSYNSDCAISNALELYNSGADIIDVGGESTRPGASPVSAEEEIQRVLPVVDKLVQQGIPVSIDTRNSIVMTKAIAAGVSLVNDVSAFTYDPNSLAVIANSEVGIILMHMQGIPETMQIDPKYSNGVVIDTYDYLSSRINACIELGVTRDRICVDPGIGFGKTLLHNMELISNLGIFHGLGCALGIGLSRKSFIQAIVGEVPPEERLGGSLASMINAIDQGANLLRVHDVKETVQAVSVWKKINTPKVDR